MHEFLADLAPHWSPHPGQAAYLAAEARVRVLACGRRWGKTDVVAVETVHALRQSRPTRHLTLAPTLEQARLLFDRVVEMLTALGEAPKITRTPHPKLTLGNHRLSARSGHLGYALRGAEATHVVIDEAAFVPEALITEVAMPMLATTEGSLTLISTPRGMNHFYRLHQMGARGEHGVWSGVGVSAENPRVSEAFLAQQRELLSERAFRTEYEAAFLDAAGQVFRTEAVERCLVAQLGGPFEPPYSIGVDWARYGDYTAIAVLCGTRDASKLIALEQIHGVGWGEQVARVAALLERFAPARVLCDATGVGDPALEMLQARLARQPIEGVTFTNAVKAALVDNLAWMFENGAIQFTSHPDLLRELQHFEAMPSRGGLTRYGAGQGFHDDLVIALALAARQLPRPYRAQMLTSGPRTFTRQRIPQPR